MGPLPRSSLSALLLCTLGGPVGGPVALAALGPAGLSLREAPLREATPQDAKTGASDDPRALDRRRVLILEDGRVLRGRARRVDGQWLRRVGREWRPVEGNVARQRPEKELLATASRLASQVPRGDHSRRAELARWMARSGLHDEALAELDRILRDDRDHPAALAVIDQTPLELELHPDRPGTSGLVTALMKAGAGGTPARREVAVRRLGDLSDSIDLRKVVEAELETDQLRRRALAALAARRLVPGELREALLRRAILDGSRAVREEAAFALRDARDVALASPAVRALGSAHAGVRANAAEALGNMGYDAAVEPLMTHLASTVAQAGGGATGTRANLYLGLQTAYVMDFDVEIAQAASIADPIVGVQASGVVFDVRSTVQMTQIVELRAVMRSLRQLTGQDIPDDVGRWQAWWGENADRWRARERAEAYAQGSAGRTATR